MRLWTEQIKSIVTKKRVDPRDDQETEFIDIDLIMELYIGEYKKLNLAIRDKI